MTVRITNGFGSMPAPQADADRARVFTSLVMAENRSGAQARAHQAQPWAGQLNGKPCSAQPQGPRAANGDQMWRVKWLPDGRTPVQVDTALREQFGPQHVQPGTPVRRALETQWGANQSGPRPWTSADGFMGRPVEAKPVRRVPGTDKHVWEVSVGAPATQKGGLASMLQKPATATVILDGAFDARCLSQEHPLGRELKAKLGA